MFANEKNISNDPPEASPQSGEVFKTIPKQIKVIHKYKMFNIALNHFRSKPKFIPKSD